MTTFAQQLQTAFPADAYDDDDVTQALAWAESFVNGYCNRSFDVVTNDVAVLDPFGNHSAMLPMIPVIDVTLVEGYLPSTSGMAWVGLSNFWFKKDTGFIFDTTGLPGTVHNTGSYSWPWMPGSLRVTYSHGYDPVPADLVNVAGRLAKQWLENPGLRVQLKVGDIEERFNGSFGVTLGALDQAILDRYSLMSVA